MPKLRYDTETGKVNLIVGGDQTKEMNVKGMGYRTIKTYPHFDRDKENLYVLHDKIVAIDETHWPPLHRIIE
jgi:hypothetical protein